MKKDTILTIVTYTFHACGLYAARPYLSLLAQDCGADSVQIGLIISAFSVVQVVCALLVSRIIQRRGYRFVSTCGTTLFTLSTAGLLFTRSLPLIALCALLMGLSHGTVLLSGQYMMTGTAPDEQPRAVGYFAFSGSVGMFLGPLLGGYLTQRLGLNLGYIGALFMGLLSLITVLFVSKTPVTAKPQHHGDLIELLRSPRVVRNVLISGTVFFAIDIINTYLPLYGKQIGLGTAAIGMVLGAHGVAQMTIRPLMRFFTRRLGVARAFCYCMCIGGVSMLQIGLMKSFVSLTVAACLAGFAIGLANPLTLLTVTDVAPQDKRGSVLALRVMSNYAGQTLSPILFGALAGAAGISPVFIISGAVLAVCALPQRREIRLTAAKDGAKTP